MNEKEIKSSIAKHFKVELELIVDDLMVGDIPQWDSLGHISLMSHLEQEFNLSIDVDQSLEMETIEDIVEILNEINGGS
jgi:acyl carrier protein